MTSPTGRYRSTGEIKEGGFSSVKFYEDTHLSRRVAIKFIRSTGEKHRLLDELRALMQLRSKHVVQIYDIVKRGIDEIGIVEEYIDGEDLLDNDYPRKDTEAYLKILWQLSAGLTDIHSANVVHRDIKPNNVKLDKEGIVKIFDFGLARMENLDAKTRGFKGTHGFAAPELYRDDTTVFTKAVDTYAFGATAFYIATLSLPKELLRQPPRPPIPELFSGLPVDIPPTIQILLERCLDKDPTARPEMGEVCSEIARYLLEGKHQALVVYEGKASYLNASKKVVRLSLPSIGKIEIFYDGLKFFINSVDGEVFINNMEAYKGMVLPGSCVVSLGASYRRTNARAFITFDVSKPEVVL